VVHGIHIAETDIARRAATDSIVVSCPTTEGSLGDGHFPALRWHDAGVRIAIGSDSQVWIDLFEETRELETLARRERQTRFALLARTGDLWEALARSGRESLGLDDARNGGDRSRPPRPARRRGPGPALRRGDVRIGRGRRGRRAPRLTAPHPTRRHAVH
jgi:hypothetical protein